MPNLGKKEAVFFLESQPPHLGELIPVLLKKKDYNKIHVCVSSTIKVVPLQKVIATWLFLLDAYKIEGTVSSLLPKFEELSELPPMFKNCTVLTTSQKVYVHMTSLGIEVELVPKALGYCSTFLRTAYRQSRALDYLRGMAAQAAKYTPGENKNE